MKKFIGSVVVIVTLLIGVAVFYMSKPGSAPVLQPVAPQQASSTTPPQPAKHYPLPEEKDPQAASKPLPSLEQSDPSVMEAISGSLVHQSLKDLIRLDGLVRNIVVTIDNLPRQTMAVRQFPVAPAGSAFAVSGADENLSIAAENAKRYAPYAQIAEGMDAKSLVDAYVHLYPLFQRAYEELGYPNGYFNDRLITVIDHLLNTPEINGPIALVQSHVQYRFADPALEADSAGHKVMIRMGAENAAKVKAKLREIRRELTRHIPPK